MKNKYEFNLVRHRDYTFLTFLTFIESGDSYEINYKPDTKHYAIRDVEKRDYATMSAFTFLGALNKCVQHQFHRVNKTDDLFATEEDLRHKIKSSIYHVDIHNKPNEVQLLEVAACGDSVVVRKPDRTVERTTSNGWFSYESDMKKYIDLIYELEELTKGY